jgi:hypothetical protein
VKDPAMVIDPISQKEVLGSPADCSFPAGTLIGDFHRLTSVLPFLLQFSIPAGTPFIFGRAALNACCERAPITGSAATTLTRKAVERRRLGTFP